MPRARQPQKQPRLVFRTFSQESGSTLRPFSGSDLQHEPLSQLWILQENAPQSSSLLFQSQMFRPPFPGLRGPKQVSPDHTTGRCLSRCRHPRPRRQGQRWARREDLACSQQRPLLQVSAQSQAPPFSPEVLPKAQRRLRAEASWQTCVLSRASALNAWAPPPGFRWSPFPSQPSVQGG